MTLSRKDIGRILRNLRKKQALTGEELGALTGMSQAKISKIETGALNTLSVSDISSILNILKTPLSISQQIYEALNNEDELSKLAVYRAFEYHSLKDERQTMEYLVYCNSLVPSLLQTMEYRHALLTVNGYSTPYDELKKTMARQDMLWEKNKSVRIIIAEAALYTAFTAPRIHQAQLDRIERFFGVPHITIGILPVKAGMPSVDTGNFGIYDRKILIDALIDREISTSSQSHISVYLKIFEQLCKMSAYDEAAITLIRKAATHFQ